MECDDINMQDGDSNDLINEEEIPEVDKKAYIPGVSRPLKEGEELEFDPEAYKLFHSFETKWPCLSFDVVRDGLGENREDFPIECYLVAGTQADKPKHNEIIVMGLKNLTGLHKDASESDEESDNDEDNEENSPKMHAACISHHGGINRIRVDRLGDSTVCAVWNDVGKIQLWNLTGPLNQVNAMSGGNNTIKLMEEKPLFTFGDKKEGFGLAWSQMKKGDLATGNKLGKIHVWHMHEGGTWTVDQRPLSGHTGTVEDLVWSPNEVGLLASCSSDGAIRLWDTRVSPIDSCACTVTKAHDSDVNVLSWNTNDSLLVTGGDDSVLKIWSLKTIQFGQPVARFKYHNGPITSVEWHPQDSTTFMASGEDDQTSIWDIATEADGETVEGVPPQLMFLHLGQSEVKEVHWHPQIPGLACNTSVTGFNVFKTINI